MSSVAFPLLLFLLVLSSLVTLPQSSLAVDTVISSCKPDGTVSITGESIGGGAIMFVHNMTNCAITISDITNVAAIRFQGTVTGGSVSITNVKCESGIPSSFSGACITFEDTIANMSSLVVTDIQVLFTNITKPHDYILGLRLSRTANVETIRIQRLMMAFTELANAQPNKTTITNVGAIWLLGSRQHINNTDSIVISDISLFIDVTSPTHDTWMSTVVFPRVNGCRSFSVTNVKTNIRAVCGIGSGSASSFPSVSGYSARVTSVSVGGRNIQSTVVDGVDSSISLRGRQHIRFAGVIVDGLVDSGSVVVRNIVSTSASGSSSSNSVASFIADVRARQEKRTAGTTPSALLVPFAAAGRTELISEQGLAQINLIPFAKLVSNVESILLQRCRLEHGGVVLRGAQQAYLFGLYIIDTMVRVASLQVEDFSLESVEIESDQDRASIKYVLFINPMVDCGSLKVSNLALKVKRAHTNSSSLPVEVLIIRFPEASAAVDRVSSPASMVFDGMNILVESATTSKSSISVIVISFLTPVGNLSTISCSRLSVFVRGQRLLAVDGDASESSYNALSNSAFKALSFSGAVTNVSSISLTDTTVDVVFAAPPNFYPRRAIIFGTTFWFLEFMSDVSDMADGVRIKNLRISATVLSSIPRSSDGLSSAIPSAVRFAGDVKNVANLLFEKIAMDMQVHGLRPPVPAGSKDESNNDHAQVSIIRQEQINSISRVSKFLFADSALAVNVTTANGVGIAIALELQGVPPYEQQKRDARKYAIRDVGSFTIRGVVVRGSGHTYANNKFSVVLIDNNMEHIGVLEVADAAVVLSRLVSTKGWSVAVLFSQEFDQTNFTFVDRVHFKNCSLLVTETVASETQYTRAKVVGLRGRLSHSQSFLAEGLWLNVRHVQAQTQGDRANSGDSSDVILIDIEEIKPHNVSAIAVVNSWMNCSSSAPGSSTVCVLRFDSGGSDGPRLETQAWSKKIIVTREEIEQDPFFMTNNITMRNVTLRINEAFAGKGEFLSLMYINKGSLGMRDGITITDCTLDISGARSDLNVGSAISIINGPMLFCGPITFARCRVSVLDVVATIDGIDAMQRNIILGTDIDLGSGVAIALFADRIFIPGQVNSGSNLGNVDRVFVEDCEIHGGLKSALVSSVAVVQFGDDVDALTYGVEVRNTLVVVDHVISDEKKSIASIIGFRRGVSEVGPVIISNVTLRILTVVASAKSVARVFGLVFAAPTFNSLHSSGKLKSIVCDNVTLIVPTLAANFYGFEYGHVVRGAAVLVAFVTSSSLVSVSESVTVRRSRILQNGDDHDIYPDSTYHFPHLFEDRACTSVNCLVVGITQREKQAENAAGNSSSPGLAARTSPRWNFQDLHVRDLPGASLVGFLTWTSADDDDNSQQQQPTTTTTKSIMKIAQFTDALFIFERITMNVQSRVLVAGGLKSVLLSEQYPLHSKVDLAHSQWIFICDDDGGGAAAATSPDFLWWRMQTIKQLKSLPEPPSSAIINFTCPVSQSASLEQTESKSHSDIVEKIEIDFAPSAAMSALSAVAMLGSAAAADPSLAFEAGRTLSGLGVLSACTQYQAGANRAKSRQEKENLIESAGRDFMSRDVGFPSSWFPSLTVSGSGKSTSTSSDVGKYVRGAVVGGFIFLLLVGFCATARAIYVANSLKEAREERERIMMDEKKRSRSHHRSRGSSMSASSSSSSAENNKTNWTFAQSILKLGRFPFFLVQASAFQLSRWSLHALSVLFFSGSTGVERVFLGVLPVVGFWILPVSGFIWYIYTWGLSRAYAQHHHQPQQQQQHYRGGDKHLQQQLLQHNNNNNNNKIKKQHQQQTREDAWQVETGVFFFPSLIQQQQPASSTTTAKKSQQQQPQQKPPQKLTSLQEFLTGSVGRYLFFGDSVWSQGSTGRSITNGAPGQFLNNVGSVVVKFHGPLPSSSLSAKKETTTALSSSSKRQVAQRSISPYNIFVNSIFVIAASGCEAAASLDPHRACTGAAIALTVIAALSLTYHILIKPATVPFRNLMQVIGDCSTVIASVLVIVALLVSPSGKENGDADVAVAGLSTAAVVFFVTSLGVAYLSLAARGFRLAVTLGLKIVLFVTPAHKLQLEREYTARAEEARLKKEKRERLLEMRRGGNDDDIINDNNSPQHHHHHQTGQHQQQHVLVDIDHMAAENDYLDDDQAMEMLERRRPVLASSPISSLPNTSFSSRRYQRGLTTSSRADVRIDNSSNAMRERGGRGGGNYGVGTAPPVGLVRRSASSSSHKNNNVSQFSPRVASLARSSSPGSPAPPPPPLEETRNFLLKKKSTNNGDNSGLSKPLQKIEGQMRSALSERLKLASSSPPRLSLSPSSASLTLTSSSQRRQQPATTTPRGRPNRSAAERFEML